MAHNGNKLSGKLELNWVNKNKTLIVKDYEKGSYEWVDRNDYRVSEVRLLKKIEKVGENSTDNLIICGDSLNALTSLTKIPEYRQKYVNKVKLIYIDPPFNTGQMFANYDDQLEHSVWLTMMRDRVLKSYELLSDDGSLWVHLDDTELYHFKLVLDEIFGKENFVANVVWQRRAGGNTKDVKGIFSIHDYILIYSRNENWMGNFLNFEVDLKGFKHKDEKGYYKLRSLRQGGNASLRSDRPTMYYPLITPNGKEIYPVNSNGKEGRWVWSKETYEQRKEEIQWIKGKNGSYVPYRRQYAEKSGSFPSTSWWTYEEVRSNAEAKQEIKKLSPKIFFLG